jgi:multicomponent Na+:H+ antiporter subunit G
MLEWFRLILSALLIFAGLLVLAVGIIGQYRFRYVLNRMHAASMGDTLGLLLIVAGLCVSLNDGWMIVKMLLLVVFFWITSPTSSHLIARLEATTDEHLDRWMEVRKR